MYMKHEDLGSDELVARETEKWKCTPAGQTGWDGQRSYSDNVDKLGWMNRPDFYSWLFHQLAIWPQISHFAVYLAFRDTAESQVDLRI